MQQPEISIHPLIGRLPKINLNITQKHYNISKPASIPQSPPGKPPLPHTPKKQNGQTASHPTKKRAPGPNTQELSQNQTTSSTPPQLPQLPLQPIRTRRY